MTPEPAPPGDGGADLCPSQAAISGPSPFFFTSWIVAPAVPTRCQGSELALPPGAHTEAAAAGLSQGGRGVASQLLARSLAAPAPFLSWSPHWGS